MKKEPKKIIDTHSHILTRFLGDEGVKEIAENALEEGIIIINTTPTFKSTEDAIAINKKYPWIIPTAGIHGLFISEYKDGDIDEIDEIIDSHIAAVGEVGLDYDQFTSEEEKRLQNSVFVSQIRMARRHELPVVVHTRNSARDNLEVIAQFKDVKFVIHDWEGNTEETKELIKVSKNIYFGFGGKITQKDKEVSDVRKETIGMIPLNRILLESDTPSPDTLPQTLMNKGIEKSEPQHIRETVKWLARFLKVKQDDLIDKCNKNAIDFFNLPKDILTRDFKSELEEAEGNK